jgi:two-component system LytT family response regulator
MTGFRVLVADDEPLARRMIARLVESDPEVAQVIQCADARAIRDELARDRPDIAFLDIEMPEASGLDISESIGSDGPVVIFVTAFSQYAAAAFGVSAVDYVLKPFSDERFHAALERAKRRVRERRLTAMAAQLAAGPTESRAGDRYRQRFTCKAGDQTIEVPAADVIWIEAEDYYVLIHSKRGRHLLRMPMATLERTLDPRSFVRVHRAAIVNVAELDHVEEANGRVSIRLSDGSLVPVSRARHALARRLVRR